MQVATAIIYGLLVFFATVLASIPIGILEGAYKARGTALSAGRRMALQWTEYLFELSAVVAVLSHLYARLSVNALPNALVAVLLAGLLSYVIEVRMLRMHMKELVIRVLVALAVCIPLGAYIAHTHLPVA